MPHSQEAQVSYFAWWLIFALLFASLAMTLEGESRNE